MVDLWDLEVRRIPYSFLNLILTSVFSSFQAHNTRRLDPVEHLFDTIRVLGGAKGLAVLVVILAIFYYFVVYMITRRHQITAGLKQQKVK
jgi:hypothetical protein